MGKSVITADRAVVKEKNNLRLEVAEIKEISELLFNKLDKKIQTIENLSAAVDAKLALVEQTMKRSEVVITSAGIDATVPQVNKKISELQLMIQRVETVASRAVAAIESSTNKRFAAFEQMLRNSEVVRAQALEATETSVDRKIASIGQVVQHAELFEKKIQSLLSAEAAVENKTTLLEQLIQRATAVEKKMQAAESLETSIDKKIGALEMLARRAEAMKSLGGTSNRQHEIVALRQKGLQTTEIGEVLDMPVGEVELILELFPQKA
jgi:hypothetical protein